MANQLAVPASDVATGTWRNELGATSGLSESLNEAEASISDVDHVLSSLNPNDDTLNCALTPIGAPAAGTVTLKIRGKKGRIENRTWHWLAVPNATSYRLQVGTTTGGIQRYDANVGYTLNFGLYLTPGTYYSRVVPYVGATPGTPSDEEIVVVT